MAETVGASIATAGRTTPLPPHPISITPARSTYPRPVAALPSGGPAPDGCRPHRQGPMFPGCDERVAASALNPNRSDLTMIERISNVVSAMMLTACVTGCAQRGHFTAATLPAELQAPPVENSQTIDLSCLAGPAASRDLIGPGDLLKVSLAAGLDAGAVVNIFARVGDDGIALLPEVGPIHLAGLYLVQAEQQIAAACVGRGLYRQPHVTVAMEQQRTNRVTVVGAVKEPGIHELPRGSSYLLAGIMAAGGLAEDGPLHDAGGPVCRQHDRRCERPGPRGSTRSGRSSASGHRWRVSR